MSLFPAYSDGTVPTNAVPSQETATASAVLPTWLTNSSYEKIPDSVPIDIDDVTEFPSAETTKQPSTKVSTKDNQEHKNKKKGRAKSSHKKKRRHNRDESPKRTEAVHQFTGNEDFYVDKKSERGYLRVETLHRPVCPKYRACRRTIGTLPYRRSGNTYKRYYVKSRRSKIAIGDWDDVERLDEDEFVTRNRSFNKRLGENPGDIELWMEFVRHQDLTYMKSAKLHIVERKLDILDKALRENPSNERLYKLYVEIIDRAYPSFEVSKILDKLLSKDSTNYTLWHAQIMASQGSMARCIVPDVLALYEQCMKNMYNKNRYDEVMLKLFTNCCLFLRQSGLYEQFFALIKLALELNVSANKFHKIQPVEQDQHTLIEYEEVILASGLPMNEIWLRIEKLRQNFYFLPCPEDRSCADLSRIVFNQDIVHFVYPLANREYTFNLIVIIMKLLKIPLPGHSLQHCFFTRQENISEFDAVEDVLPIFLHKPFLDCGEFDAILFDLIKDFSVGPSYVTTNLGHELYLNVVTEFLMLFADCMETPQRRNIFWLLWLKFERVLLRLDNFLDKTTPEKLKKLRSKIKNLLRRDENRNALIFYTEYALIEYELGDVTKMESIFLAALGETRPTDNDYARSEFYATHIAYVELLIRERQFGKAIAVLTSLAAGGALTVCADEVAETKKLLALKQIGDVLGNLIFIERNVVIMELEQCFLPDYLVSAVKAKVYYLLLVRSKAEALREVEVLLRTFPERNNRHAFVRESLYEVYANAIQVAAQSGHDANRLMYDVLQRGLAEFPNNLTLCRMGATLEGQTWYKIRTLLSRSNSPVSILLLVAAAKYRYQKYRKSLDGAPADFMKISSDIDANEYTYKVRVCNLLRNVSGQNSTARKNPLLWRIYLRSLLDVNKNFEQSRNALFAALDECPWNKAIYLDGSVYVPQELCHVQDLIIEKQLRIYALPEELEILRSDEVAGGATAPAAATMP